MQFSSIRGGVQSDLERRGKMVEAGGNKKPRRAAKSIGTSVGWDGARRTSGNMSVRFDDIGDRLKAFRMASGLNADDIAARIGISRAALYRYE